MAKEVFLYSPMYPFVIQGLMSQLEEYKGQEVDMRVSSPGGFVRPSWGLFAKMKEHGKVNLKIGGGADSMAAFLPMYAKTSQCLSVTKLVFHRADMPVETPEDQTFLDGINADLKTQMSMRVNPEKWKAVTGITIDELFDPKTRIDYEINANQALELGLVNSIYSLTPELELQEIEAYSNNKFAVAANTQKIPTMTIEELKTKHPDIFNQAVALGKTEGLTSNTNEAIAKEKERIEAWLYFMETDPKAVSEGIKSGKAMTQAETFALFEKKTNAIALKALGGEAAPPIKTEAEKVEAEKKIKDAAEKAIKEKAEAWVNVEKYTGLPEGTLTKKV